MTNPEYLCPESDLTVKEFLPAAFYEALDQFNQEKYFECHETLEKLWIADKTETRQVYQGVLQIAVGCFHLVVRSNRIGAVNKLDAGARRLEQAGLLDFPPFRYGIDWAKLLSDTLLLVKLLKAQDLDLPPSYSAVNLPKIHFKSPFLQAINALSI